MFAQQMFLIFDVTFAAFCVKIRAVFYAILLFLRRCIKRFVGLQALYYPAAYYF